LQQYLVISGELFADTQDSTPYRFLHEGGDIFFIPIRKQPCPGTNRRVRPETPKVLGIAKAMGIGKSSHFSSISKQFRLGQA